MKKLFISAAIPVLIFASFAIKAQGSVDFEQIREAGLRTAIVNAVPIEGSIIGEVFNGNFFSTSIDANGKTLELALVHEYEGVIRSYGLSKEASSRSAVIDFIKDDFVLGLEKDDPKAKEMLQALRLVHRVDNVFPHVVKRNGADIWTLAIGEAKNGMYEGFRVRINAEMKPVDIQHSREIPRGELVE
jgi:hypothetical protein